MKKFLAVIIMAVCVFVSGCNEKPNSDIIGNTKNTVEKSNNDIKNNTKNSGGKLNTEWIQNVRFDSDDEQNPQSNLILGDVVENKNFIVFSEYVYSKKDNKVSSLCKNPTCNHEPNKRDCILNRGICSKQVYEDIILCTTSESTKIYELDPEIGELKEKYDVGIEVSDFRMIGKDLALVASGDNGFYTVDLKSGKKIQIMKTEFYNCFYTIEGEYMYVSLADLSLHKVSLKGEGDTLLAEKTGRPIVYNKNVYYGYWQDEDWNLRCVDIEGKKDTVILEDMMMHTIYKDKIYYYTASYPRMMMMCNMDGSEKKKIGDGDGLFYILPETGKIFIASDNDEGWKYQTVDLDGNNLQVLYEVKNEQ